jgi:hypothetical protein
MTEDQARIVADAAEKLGVQDSPLAGVAMLDALLGFTDGAVKLLGAAVNISETAKAEKANPLRPAVGRYSRVEKKLIEMLTQSTGAHFLDSGGAYGRHWESNRHVTDWGMIPLRSADVWVRNDGSIEISITTNLFPYLAARLDLSKETTRLNAAFKRFAERSENRDESWPVLSERFVRHLKAGGKEIEEGPYAFNTFNGDSTLSQVLQGVYFQLKETFYVILQIHQGADVRGGYTDPYIFEALEDQGAGMPDMAFDERDISAECACVAFYSDDCGFHWYLSYERNETPNDTLDGTDFRPETKYQTERNDFPKNWRPRSSDNDDDHGKLTCTLCHKDVQFN